MAWKDDLATPFTITTGDGKTYTLLWKSPSLSVEYNASVFDFPNVSGSLVARGTPKGRRFPAEIYFVGEDHLDTAREFEESAADPRPWTITHPYYGQLLVQPISLNFDNTGENVSLITGDLVETITEQYPLGGIVPQNKIQQATANAIAAAASAYVASPPPTAATISTAQSNNRLLYNIASPFADATTASNYLNIYNKALSETLNAAEEQGAAITAMQMEIQAPAYFAVSVVQRAKVYRQSLDRLRMSVRADVDRTLRELYQALGGTLVASLCLSSSTPQQTDYVTRTSVLAAIDGLLEVYRLYVADLDLMQSPTGGTPTSFVPDADLLTQLDSLVNFTVSNLFNIALGAKQERKLILENDSNWIMIAHRLYGLDAADVNIQTLIDQNEGTYDEYLCVKKGRKIIYYI